MASVRSRGSKQEIEYVRNHGRLPTAYAANGITPVLDLAGYGAGGNGEMTSSDRLRRKPMDFLNQNSQRDNASTPLIVNGTTPLSAVKPIGTHDGRVPRAKKEVVFSTDMIPQKWGGNRYILLSNVHKDELEEGGTFSNLSEDCGWELMLYTVQAVINSATGKLDYYLVFNDMRAAESALDQVSMFIDCNNCCWKASFSTYTDLITAVSSAGQVLKKKLTWYEGQVMFYANFKGPSAEFSIEGVEDAVYRVANSYGQISGFREIDGAEHPRIMFRVEYFMLTDAHRALKEASKDDPRVEMKWHIHAEELKPSPKPSSPVNGVDGITNALAGSHLSTPRRTHDGAEVSPTGRTGWRVDENGNTIPVLPKRTMLGYGNAWSGMPLVAPYGVPAIHRYSEPVVGSPGMVNTLAPRSGSYPGAAPTANQNARQGSSPDSRRIVPGPQAVDLDRIRRGHDMRTTLMLRNIPNRMMAPELKTIIDKTSLGKYDFSYLRIDFEKGTNVGYAFVNFSDPMHIIAFVEEYMGKQWAPPNKRVVELSYATIQGLDCLIEKFRNSAVMSECPQYRPMIWHTDENAPSPDLIGAPADFPAPNNNMKLQRSHDNAGQVGLYAPRSVRENRGARVRHSNFDRGTPHQQYEDAYHHQMSPTAIPHNFGHYTYLPQPHYPMMHPAAPPAWHMPAYNNAGFVPGYMPSHHMPVMPYGQGFTGSDPFYNSNGGFHHAYHNGAQRPFGNSYAPKKHMEGGPVQAPADAQVPRILDGERDHVSQASKAANGGQGACRNPSPHQL